jgi:hypothetical protein
MKQTNELSSLQMKEVKGGKYPSVHKPRMEDGTGHCVSPEGDSLQPCVSDEICQQALADEEARCVDM